MFGNSGTSSNRSAPELPTCTGLVPACPSGLALAFQMIYIDAKGITSRGNRVRPRVARHGYAPLKDPILPATKETAPKGAHTERTKALSATLKLTREGVGIELRRGTFEIDIDGVGVGSIEPHEAKEISIEPGHHTLALRRGRYRSRPHSFDVRNESVVSFRCHGAMMWPRWVASALKPDLGISLTRE